MSDLLASVSPMGRVEVVAAVMVVAALCILAIAVRNALR